MSAELIDELERIHRDVLQFRDHTLAVMIQNYPNREDYDRIIMEIYDKADILAVRMKRAIRFARNQ